MENKNNLKIGMALVVCLILGAIMGRASPISNSSKNDNSSKVFVTQEIPGKSKNFQDFSRNSKIFQEKININTATFLQLKKLKGVGDSKAKAIIDNRPYESVEDLVNKGIVGVTSYPKIEPNITVGD